MAHKHEYETVERHAVSAEARAKGVEAAEIRKCTGCGHEAVFLHVQGKWLLLFDETQRSEKDILLA